MGTVTLHSDSDRSVQIRLEVTRNVAILKKKMPNGTRVPPSPQIPAGVSAPRALNGTGPALNVHVALIKPVERSPLGNTLGPSPSSRTAMVTSVKFRLVWMWLNVAVLFGRGCHQSRAHQRARQQSHAGHTIAWGDGHHLCKAAVRACLVFGVGEDRREGLPPAVLAVQGEGAVRLRHTFGDAITVHSIVRSRSTFSQILLQTTSLWVYGGHVRHTVLGQHAPGQYIQSIHSIGRMAQVTCLCNEFVVDDRAACGEVRHGAGAAAATSCLCSRGRPPPSFAPANHKCGNTCPQTGMCSLSIATPPCGGATVFTRVHSRTTRRFQTSAWDVLYPRPSRWDGHVWY